MSHEAPLTNEAWRAKYAERHRVGTGTMTLDQVMALTENDIFAAKKNPDFAPSEDKQSLVLCERLLKIGDGDRFSLMSTATLKYIKELQGRGWITEAALKKALYTARTEFEDDHASSRDPRWRWEPK